MTIEVTGTSNYSVTVGIGDEDLNKVYEHICIHDDTLIVEHIGGIHGVMCPLCGASWLTKEMTCEAQ